MRSPRASAVVVALSGLVAVITVSAVLSQVAPVGQAGAVLPIAPITAPGGSTAGDPSPDASPDSTTTVEPGEPIADEDGTAVVVEPAPAHALGPEPSASPDPSEPPAPPESPTPTPAPTSPGNSGSAPGHGTTNPGDTNANPNSGK